ncbi:CynX/NimT family MFS transporter [Brevibacterium marinum]|uniref:CP family cyanate transporter-like MFS transporter n=1 Tax=Brevibacterium marinum TaxID=418643 RepID=A0A846S5R1_9MICO|nr:MFS transporter [Brevibacterium marinum]NJC58373.1 CP family cyanate transporter-like MFS transporter [Brevibacterium marinum]
MNTSPQHSYRTGRGLDLLALASIILIACSLRPAASSLGPVLSEVNAAFALAEWQTGLLTALPGLIFAICGFIAVPFLKRLGLFRSLLFSCALIVVGVGTRAFVDGWLLFAGLTILALAGMSLGNVILPVFVKSRFPDRTSLAATAFTVSLGLGSMFPAFLTAPIAAQSDNWRVGLGVWALVPTCALVTWIVLKLARSIPSLDRSAEEAHGARPPRRHIYVSPKARYMAMFFGLQSVNAYVQFGWVPQIYRDAGIDPVLAGVMLTIVTFGGIPGGFLAPQIIMRGILPRFFLVTFAVSAVLGYLGLLLVPTTMPALWAIFLAYGGFAFPAALALITGRTTDVSITARTSAFVQSSGYVLAAIGPLAVGGLLGLSGGWSVPLWFMVAVSVLMGVTGYLAGSPGTVDEELASPEDRNAPAGRLGGTADR